MGLILVIVALLLVVITHEYAHHKAMSADGVRTIEAGLGLPFPPVLRIKRNGFTWTVSPWLLGAYVAPDPKAHAEADRTLPYRSLAWHYNAGVLVNIVTGAATLAGYYLLTGRHVAGAALAGAAVLVWWQRHRVAAYVLPALSPAALILLVWALVRTWMRGETGLGLAGLGSLAPRSISVTSILGLVAGLALSLALLNMLPFPPVDNGRVMHLVVRRWSPPTARALQVGGLVFVMVLLVAAVASDGWHLIAALLH